MKLPIGICTCGNNKFKGNINQLLLERSKGQIEKILGSPFFNGKIPAPLYENILRSAEKKETILLDVVGKDYLKPLNELAVMLSTKWTKREITVKFLHKSTYLETYIKEYVKEWERHANIEFVFVEDGNADVRISFFQDGTSWSKLGNECLKVTDQNEPTMNFGWFNNHTDLAEIRRTTLHEFGHVLGCIHEHQQPEANIYWDETKTLAYFKSSNGWDADTTRFNVLDKLPTENLTNSDYDSDSIMHYFFPSELTIDRRVYRLNYSLSQHDIDFISSQYPF